jgi:hypothetical protein
MFKHAIWFTSVRIAQGLAIRTSVVLMIYAADAGAKEDETRGFLKIDTITRVAVFGGSVVARSCSKKKKDKGFFH